MSESGRKDLAYPKSQVQTAPFIIFRLCGGAGGGDCAFVLGYNHLTYSFKVSKFIVFNRSLILNNPEFNGVEVFSDGGAAGLCDHTTDVRQGWWLAFSDDGLLTTDQVMATGTFIEATAPPFDIEVQWNKLPQPVLAGGGANPNWESRIYVHIVWSAEDLVTTSAALINQLDNVLTLIKHDYDEKI